MVSYFPEEWFPTVRGDVVAIVSVYYLTLRIHPRTIVVMSNMYKRMVREALEINRLKH